MDGEPWDPKCIRPATTRPVRVDPSGVAGPTPNQARGPGWRCSTRGLFVPASVKQTVEQRIHEQSMRLRHDGGAIGGWAALRWRGGRYFDGESWNSDSPLPVPLLLGGAGPKLRPSAGVVLTRTQLPPGEIESIGGLPCAVATRAIFDEVRRIGTLREGVVAVDMASAAGLLSITQLAAYAETRYAWTGIPLLRKVLTLASDDARSPQEVRMRLVWVLDAGLPTPMCNQPVFTRAGDLLGIPDLFDQVAGVVGEYDGRDHAHDDRRRRDLNREQGFRDHGLEYFALVRGDLVDRSAVVRRMLNTRARARFLPPDRRTWTLEKPAWWLRRSG